MNEKHRRPRNKLHVSEHARGSPLGAVKAAVSLLIALWLAATASVLGAPLQVFNADAVRLSRLDSGLRVVVKEDHSWPVVAINLVVRAGSCRESAQDNGIAHCLEHMIFRSAGSAGPDSLSAPIEAVGGTVNGGTLRDYTYFTAIVPAPQFAMALERLARAVTKPSFRGLDITAEKIVLLREAQQAADQPDAAAWDTAFRLAYNGHAYGLPIGGTETSLASINADALEAFHRRWYTANNASIVIVGDVGGEQARTAVASAFAQWPAADPPPDLPALPPLEVSQESVTQRDVSAATVLMGFRTIGTANPREVCAVDLLLTILGEGYSSRLQRALLEGHLADEMAANFLTQKLPGLLGIRVECAPERVPNVRSAIEREVTRLQQEAVGDDELERAKQRVIRAVAFTAETFGGQAALLGFYEAIATYENALNYLDAVRALTSADVQAAASAYLVPGRAVWVAIMPTAEASTGPASPPGAP